MICLGTFSADKISRTSGDAPTMGLFVVLAISFAISRRISQEMLLAFSPAQIQTTESGLCQVAPPYYKFRLYITHWPVEMIEVHMKSLHWEVSNARKHTLRDYSLGVQVQYE